MTLGWQVAIQGCSMVSTHTRNLDASGFLIRKRHIFYKIDEIIGLRFPSQVREPMILLMSADLSRQSREIVRDSRLWKETNYFIQGSNHRC
jgi:hypothetical protein